MTRVGVFFGGRSVEHEVSVVTAMQCIAALPESMTAVPVYIAKDGAWYTGDTLRSLDTFRDVAHAIGGATRVTLRPEPSGGALVEVASRRGLLSGERTAATRRSAVASVVSRPSSKCQHWPRGSAGGQTGSETQRPGASASRAAGGVLSCSQARSIGPSIAPLFCPLSQ